MDIFNNLSNVQIIVSTVIFVIVFAISYTLLDTREVKEGVDYSSAGYSFLISIVVTALITYGFIYYKKENPELMKGDFYLD